MSENYLALDNLQEQLWSFALHRVITVAGKVGLLNRLAASAATPEAAAADLGLEPYAAGKVVRALCALGIVDKAGEGAYQLAPGLRPYLSGGTQDLTPFLAHLHHMYESWGENLEPWLRGEKWPTTPRSPEKSRAFGKAMQAMGAQQARRLASVLEPEGARTMLDVGGGFGHYARALRAANPDLTAVVLDTPETAALARENLAGTDDQTWLSFRAGDYHDGAAYGEGFDLVLMANVIHQEMPREAATMIAHGAAALAPGGRLVLLDFSIDDNQDASVLGALFAINMRSFGDTYPEPDLRGWMEAAGLGEITRTDLGPQRWIICGRK